MMEENWEKNGARHLLEYDRSVPLDVTVADRSSDATSRVQDIEFTGGGRRVKAFRVDPLFTLPTGRAVFLHPAPGDRSSFMEDARSLAARGVTSLLLNAPWADPGFGTRVGSMSVREYRDMVIGSAVDVRRSADLLTMGQPNPGVGFVGHSFGAMVGGMLSAVDGRFRNMVLMAGPPRFSDVARANLPQSDKSVIEAYREAMAPIDPLGQVRSAGNVSFLFQLGLEDRFIPRSGFVELFEAAAGPKDLIWYEADHYGLNEAGRSDRIEWLDARVHV